MNSLKFGLEQVLWTIYRRGLIAKKYEGFWAHWNTFANRDCEFSPYNRIYRYSRLSYVKLGKFTYVTEARLGHAKVGAFCSIGPQTTIGGGGKHPTNFLSTHPVFYSTSKISGISFSEKPLIVEMPTTQVGNDVWVGKSAIILDGVTIGNGAIIGAGAVVTKDVPAYAIVGGIPAKTIRFRFADAVIEALETWQWWHLPNEILRILAKDFSVGRLWTVDAVEELKLKSANIAFTTGLSV